MDTVGYCLPWDLSFLITLFAPFYFSPYSTFFSAPLSPLICSLSILLPPPPLFSPLPEISLPTTAPDSPMLLQLQMPLSPSEALKKFRNSKSNHLRLEKLAGNGLDILFPTWALKTPGWSLGLPSVPCSKCGLELS